MPTAPAPPSGSGSSRPASQPASEPAFEPGSSVVAASSVVAPHPPGGRGVVLVRRAFAVNLVAQILIVVTGGLVRVSGSGLGCPTWPTCVNDSLTPVYHQAQGYHAYVEFGNRLLISVVSLTALAALIAAWWLARHTGAGRGLILLGATPLVMVAVQAIVGGVTVLTGLSPSSVAVHFLVSMIAVAVSTLLVVRVVRVGGAGLGRTGDAARTPAGSTSSEPGRPIPREARALTLATAAVASAVLIVGTVVTGAGPHSGDAHDPNRFPIDARTVAWLHADLVLLFLGLVVGLLLMVRLMAAGGVLERRVRLVLGVALGQGVIGYIQSFTGLPAALVVLHMLGASVLVVAVTAMVDAAVRPVRTE